MDPQQDQRLPPPPPAQAEPAPGHAQLRRRFAELAPAWPQESQRALELYRRLLDLEWLGQAPGAELGPLRLAQSRPVLEALFDWAKAQQTRPEVPPASDLGLALALLTQHEQRLSAFLWDASLPLDESP